MTERKKNEVGNLPGYQSLGETERNLIEELLKGFQTTMEFLDWEQRTIHACFGHEDAVRDLKKLTQPFLEEMYKDDGKPHKQYFREKVARYLINSVFPLPQRFFSGRAKENSSGQAGGGMRREEESLFGGKQ